MNKKKVTKNTTESQTILSNFIKYIIQRFEINDSANPSYYIVGFKIVCDINQRDFYVETQIDYKDCKDKSDNEICVLAYNKLKPKIDEISEELVKKKFIIGSEFVPPNQ